MNTHHIPRHEYADNRHAVADRELGYLFTMLFSAQAGRRIAGAYSAGRISADEAMVLLLDCGVIESTYQTEPEPGDVAAEGLEFAREGFERLNREIDAQMGLLAA